MAFDISVSQPGAVNNAGDPKALFLKVYGGEVITAFRKTTEFMDKHKIRTITSGKSAQFPLLGQLGNATKYLARNEFITQNSINSAEEVITIDGQLYESLSLSKQDDAFNHVDVRQEYAYQIGQSLAQTFDTNVAICGLQAARQANKVTGLPGGSVIDAAGADTDADVLVAALFEAAKKLKEKNVREEAYAFVSWNTYYLLLNSTKLISADFSQANGDFAKGVVGKVAGFSIVPTNNLPDSDITGTINGKYDINASTTVALVMTKDAVGTVKLMDIASEMEWFLEAQAWVMISSMMVGHGVLNPQAAVEIRTGAPV